MHVILYAGQSKATESWVHRIREIEVGEVEFHESAEGFADRVKRVGESETVLVMVCSDWEDLGRMLGTGDLIREFPNILVLPERSPICTSLGYGLYPRFMTYLDGDPEEVAGILKGMKQRFCNLESMWKSRDSFYGGR